MASSAVSSAAQWIGSVLIQEAGLFIGMEEEMQSLQEEMELMQLYLRDADSKQGSREIRALIGKIRKLAYNAEDVIDSYVIETEAKGRRTYRLLRLARFLRSAPHMYEVARKMREIQATMRKVTDRLKIYGVVALPEIWDHFKTSREERYWKQKPRSYPYDDDDVGEYVVGLEGEIPKLLDVLFGQSKSQVKFLSIVGMGGSGKTTLARKLYNHHYTNDCFDCKAWVFISQEWSTHQVLLEILTKVGGSEERTKLHDGTSIGELVDKLRNTLEKKSYLIVLDDVWRREALEEILPALPRGRINQGSKIIITTRNREILLFQNHHSDMHIHEPLPLTEEEGWDLFSKLVLNHKESYDNGSFRSLGKEMLEKCDGLPLAIVALAGILNTRGNIGEWQQVNEAVRSRVMEGKRRHMYGRVQDLLALSYDDLPSYLKPCFLYLGVFPEDYQIPVGMLTRMWIAEGLVSAEDEMSLEDVAMELVEDLSNRFMLQVVRTNFKGVIKKVRLHDLLRDICVKKAKEQSFLEVYTHLHEAPNIDVKAMQPRRVALHSSTSFPMQASHLRSVVLLEESTISYSSTSHKDTLDMLTTVHQNFKLLRLLRLQGIKTVDGTLPVQIGRLIHLRYLEVHETNITKLPKSIENLRNLLTLDYRDIKGDESVPIIIEIPNVLRKLVLLRHLFLPIEYPWAIGDLSLGTLKNLRTLWGIKPGEGSHTFCREVSQLSATLKKLKIVVSKENDLQAAFSCPSLISDGLYTLHCELRDGLVLRDVEPLSHRQHLYKLVLIGEIQMKVSLLLPTNLVMLEIKDSAINETNAMEAIGGLFHLKFLSLTNFFRGTTLKCKSGSFPQLEELYLRNFHTLLVWRIEKRSMPCLKKLEIFGCRKLQDFPEGLKFITTLQQLEFYDVSPSFNKRAIECGWSEKRHLLPHNYEAIIQHSDSAIQSSSVRTLCEDLAGGISLDNGRKKYWVAKYMDSYYNCFMLYASDLRFDTRGDYSAPTKQKTYSYDNMEDYPYEKCIQVTCRSAVIVAQLMPYKTFYEIAGNLNSDYLSLDMTYEIIWVVKFEEPPENRKSLSYKLFVDGLDEEATIYSKFKLPDGRESLWVPCDLNVNPLHKWFQVSVGEFGISSSMIGEVKFYLRYDEDISRHPLVIKGVIIKPKDVGYCLSASTSSVRIKTKEFVFTHNYWPQHKEVN